MRSPSAALARSAAGANLVSVRKNRTSRTSRNRNATRIHHGDGIRRSSLIHGGVVSSPHSHGWMSVTRPRRRGSRSR